MTTSSTSSGLIKLTWFQRISFSVGDLAQNLIYQTISIWLLFYYTTVYGLRTEVAATMFLIVRIIDVIWDPIVGAFVDRANPKWGKYRSWLIIGGLPMAGFAILCFWNGFSGSLLYAYITYVGMSMCYTLVGVPYGALNSSLTRDTDEITILTSVRMLLANFASLLIKTLPLVIAFFAPKVLNTDTGEMVAVYNTPDAAGAWFITMTLFSVVGLALLIFCFVNSHENIVMDKEQSSGVRASDLWMELVRNKPLRVLAIFFLIAFTMMSVSNATDSYFMAYNIGATPFMTTVFMWLGTLPAFILLPLVPAIKRRLGKGGMFRTFICFAIAGMVLLYVIITFLFPTADSQLPIPHFILICIAQVIKNSGVLVVTGYMWALVPEVVTYGEYLTGRRVAGIVNALTCIFLKAGMALGGVIPGYVLAWVGFNADKSMQSPLALQGILWLVTIIPAILLIIGYIVIKQYELTDERMDEINNIIELRKKK